MTSTIASIVFALGILGLFALDGDRKARTSKALWIPVVWLSIASSRMVTQWLVGAGLYGTGEARTPEQLLEGSPLDRYLLTGLLALGIIVLIRRGRESGIILRANGPILLFFLYCAVSVLWSDYPDVAFKRWTKALGDIVMVMVVLTDSDRYSAVKKLLARTGFLLIPVSVLLIKYYPSLGRAYSRWEDTSHSIGVTTSKTELGGICLLFGLGFMWRLSQGLRGLDGARRIRPMIAHGAALAMVTWLFWMANSMTSLLCFIVASALMTATSFRAFSRPGVAHLLRISALTVVAVLIVSFTAAPDIGLRLVQAVGRDPTLTGRTGIWDLVLSETGDPLYGTGFESFWLGPRLEKVWRLYWWHPNEAHNGYLEVFLNLGWIGVALLTVVIVAGYHNVVVAFRREPETGRLRIAYFAIALVYNCTESAIRIMHPVWIFFLLATMAVPVGWMRINTKQDVDTPTTLREPVAPCLEGL